MNKDMYYMSMAYLCAMQSEDPSTKVGCVIVGSDKEIRSTGYNGLPRGIKHLEERLERPTKYNWIEHSERNAIYNAARIGVSVKDCTMYVTGTPCTDCARAIIQSGINTVVIDRFFDALFCSSEKWEENIKISKEMLEEAGVDVIYYEGKLYSNITYTFDGKTKQW